VFIGLLIVAVGELLLLRWEEELLPLGGIMDGK
jgi:hypothetical protein